MGFHFALSGKFMVFLEVISGSADGLLNIELCAATGSCF